MGVEKIKGLADQHTCKDLHLHLPARSRGQAVFLSFPVSEAYLRHAHLQNSDKKGDGT